MKLAIIVMALTVLTGCTALEQKAGTYREVGEMVTNPERVHVEYRRHNGVITFKETRCTGSLCEESGDP